METVLSEHIERIVSSGYFDELWYCSRYLDVAESGMNAAEHFLRHGASLGRDPGPNFSVDWYLSQYPDVAAAGMNPLLHFLQHGETEGRLPKENRAVTLDAVLWSGSEVVALPALEALLREDGVSEAELGFACWSLSRWFAFQGDWERVASLFRCFRELTFRYPQHLGPLLLGVDALTKIGALAEARVWLDSLVERFPESVDVHLAFANLLFAEANEGKVAMDVARFQRLNHIFGCAGLATVGFADASQPLSLDNLVADLISPVLRQDLPLISVIMPVFNAEKTLATALMSLLAQTHENLEIIVVDDCSKDASYSLAKAFAVLDSRVRVLRQTVNGGAYIARNTGLALARGAFITTHDADDWSHPQKLQKQLEALLADPGLIASTSHWVRCSSDLLFGRWRVEEAWVYRNVSSLLFRRKVFETLGFWDRVTVNADTEYFYRIVRAFGWEALTEVLPGLPLSFGRFDKASLSQSSATHLRTQFFGLRRNYHDAALDWHAKVANVSDLYLNPEPSERPFPAPATMCCPVLSKKNDLDLLLPLDLDFFDTAWYSRRNPDIDASGLAPLEHYLLYGGFEGRDPGPEFSSSAYSFAYPDVLSSGLNPLLHYLRYGRVLGRERLPVFEGFKPGLNETKRLLFVAHFVGEQLFGAERSFLDLLKAATELNYQVFVVLPTALNAEYMQAIRALCYRCKVMPYDWWRADRQTDTTVVANFAMLIKDWAIDLLHVNTLMLHEPLVAAKSQGIPVLVHVRELPEYDPAICEALAARPEEIRVKLLTDADIVIANSRLVGDFLAGSEKVELVPNMVDLTVFDLDNPLDTSNVRVALISSNLPKKGLEDFIAIAEATEKDCPELSFLLIGPQTVQREALALRQKQGELPGNIVLLDYMPSPQAAIAQANIILNLSHFQESFGRTVLEAMAARRVVVCYDWGALPELVVDGETGFLIPFKDTKACAEKLILLSSQPNLIKAMGLAARARAEIFFGFEPFKKRLAAIYERCLCSAAKPGLLSSV